MNDWNKIPFGAHKGKCLGVVPGKYLLQLKKDGKAKGALLEYINNNEHLLYHSKRY